nr:unnamed protein product [Callosobruchus analis]
MDFGGRNVEAIAAVVKLPHERDFGRISGDLTAHFDSFGHARTHDHETKDKPTVLNLSSKANRVEELTASVTLEKQLTSKILENLEYTNELQKSLIQSYEKDGVHSPQLKPALPIDKPGTASTYSEIAKRPSKSPLLTIRSNESASNTDVYKEVTESVNPAQMNVRTYLSTTADFAKDSPRLIETCFCPICHRRSMVITECIETFGRHLTDDFTPKPITSNA